MPFSVRPSYVINCAALGNTLSYILIFWLSKPFGLDIAGVKSQINPPTKI